MVLLELPAPRLEAGSRQQRVSDALSGMARAIERRGFATSVFIAIKCTDRPHATGPYTNFMLQHRKAPANWDRRDCDARRYPARPGDGDIHLPDFRFGVDELAIAGAMRADNNRRSKLGDRCRCPFPSSRVSSLFELKPDEKQEEGPLRTVTACAAA